jgi:hypothetical protein
MTSLAMCLLLQIAGNSGLVRHEKPLADQVELSVSADRDGYYVKEPLRLKVAIRNSGDAAVRGHFYLEPSMGFAEVTYRKVGESFIRFSYPVQPDVVKGNLVMRVITDREVGPKILKPREASSYETVLAFDAGTHRFVLEEPGEYEFKVVYRDVPNDPNSLLESNVVRVDVVPIPAGERAAGAEYTEEMASLAQFDGARYNLLGRDALRHAARFLDRYPHSPFSEKLREGLDAALRDRVTRNRASKEERGLYDKLQAEKIPNP